MWNKEIWNINYKKAADLRQQCQTMSMSNQTDHNLCCCCCFFSLFSFHTHQIPLLCQWFRRQTPKPKPAFHSGMICRQVGWVGNMDAPFAVLWYAAGWPDSPCHVSDRRRQLIIKPDCEMDGTCHSAMICRWAASVWSAAGNNII